MRFLLIVFLAAGCGDSGSWSYSSPPDDGGATADLAGGADSGAPVTPIASPQAYCDRWRDDYCSFAVRCGAWGAAADCVASLNGYCFIPVTGIGKGRATFDGSAARRCLDGAYPANGCDIDPGATNPACDQIVQGKVPLGGTCFDDLECAASAYCDGIFTSCPGSCKSRKPAGAPATYYNECPRGMTIYNGVCTAYVATGQSCAVVAPAQNGPPCQAGDDCDSVTHTCKPLRRRGQSCQSTFECIDGGSLSVCLGGVCSAPGGPGTACTTTDNGAQTQLTCRLDLYCDGANFGGSGTCKAHEPVGNPCFAAACGKGGWCDGWDTTPPKKGTCEAEKPVGAHCYNAIECQSLVCDYNVACKDPQPGDPCQSAVDCPYLFTCANNVCIPASCRDRE